MFYVDKITVSYRGRVLGEDIRKTGEVGESSQRGSDKKKER